MTQSFIVIEGMDGAGKSEVSARVAARLGAMHLESPIKAFKEIRQYVDANLCDKGRFLFYLASNLDLSRYIRKKRELQSIVCARYFYSTIIGYASRQGLDIKEFYKNLPVESDEFEIPSLTIFLYVNENVQRTRINLRESSQNSPTDFKCLNDKNYRNMLFDNYIYVAKKENWMTIDTSLMTIEEVVDACIEKITN